jgi:hypothetical protein
MKRDWDVVRQVLLEIEEGNEGKATYGDNTDPVKTGHAFLLRDAGYISAIDANTPSGRALIHPALTWVGHDLLDTIRSKTVWERVKQIAKDKGIELTFDAVKLLAVKALELVVAN